MKNEAEILAARERLKHLEELEKCPAWHRFREKLTEFATRSAAKHEDESMSAAQRAEWLHAMKNLRTLDEWVATEKAEARRILGVYEHL